MDYVRVVYRSVRWIALETQCAVFQFDDETRCFTNLFEPWTRPCCSIACGFIKYKSGGVKYRVGGTGGAMEARKTYESWKADFRVWQM